jgi:hypothetical protein
MKPIQMYPTRCPMSGEEDDAREIYPANFYASSLRPGVFSAWRLLDGTLPITRPYNTFRRYGEK